MDDLKDSNIIITDSARAIITLKTKLDTMDGIIQSQADLITQLQEKTDIVRAYDRNFTKTTTTEETLAPNTPTRILDRVTLGTNYINDFIFTSGTNAFIKETIRENLLYKDINIRVILSHTTTSLGNTQLQYELWKQGDSPTDTTKQPLVVGTPIYINDPDTRRTSCIMDTKLNNGINDNFVVSGYYLVLRNLTGTALRYNKLEISIKIVSDKTATPTK